MRSVLAYPFVRAIPQWSRKRLTVATAFLLALPGEMPLSAALCTLTPDARIVVPSRRTTRKGTGQPLRRGDANVARSTAAMGTRVVRRTF